MSQGAKHSRQDEAAGWFAVLRAGAMTVDQRQAFDSWRRDPRNQVALDAMHEMWGELAILKNGKLPLRSRRRVAPMAAVVAVLLVILAGGGGWLALSDDHTIRTVVGEQKSQSLADGSLIAVNVASQVSYDIRDAVRIVTLDQGEAAFAVKADSQRPFVVRTGDYEIRAVGTAFNVKQRNGFIEVAVSEGRVDICAATGQTSGVTLLSLDAGQQLTFPVSLREGGLASASPVSVSPELVSEWRIRVVTYEDTPVGEVVEDFNRYFEKKLLVEPTGLRNRRVTIRLQVEDRERAVAMLADLLGVEVRKTREGETLVE